MLCQHRRAYDKFETSKNLKNMMSIIIKQYEQCVLLLKMQPHWIMVEEKSVKLILFLQTQTIREGP